MDLFTLVGKIAVDASAATSNIQIVIDKVNELNLALNGTESEAQEAGKATGESFGEAAEEATQRTGSTMSKWNVFLGNMATQAANAALRMGKSFFQTGFEFNQNMEKWTASFKTYMGGDLEAASAFMEEVRQFAIETPLSLSDSVQSAVRVMASGIDKSEVIDTLRMLGDIANGDTQKMSRLALVYSQVMAAGTLKGNDPNQFKEAGVPIYDLLLDYYHANGYDYIDKAFLQEMQRKGGITSEEVLGALQMATSEGGMYYNAMNNMMNTEYGQAQKMLDSYEQAAGSFTKAIFEVFKSDTIPALNEILQQLNEWATENPEALKTLGEAFSNFATNGIGALVNGLTTLLDFFSQNKGSLEAVMMVLGGLLMVTGHPVAGAALLGTSVPEVWDEYKKTFVDPIAEDPSTAVSTAQRNLETGSTIFNYATGTGAFDEDAGGYSRDTTPIERIALWWLDFLGAGGAKEDLENAWGLTEDKGGGFRFGDPETTLPDGTSGSKGNNFLIASLQSIVSQIRAEVSAGAQEGVANGLSGITVTGMVTTGNVTLDTGAVVGELAPKFDLYLGQQDRG